MGSVYPEGCSIPSKINSFAALKDKEFKFYDIDL